MCNHCACVISTSHPQDLNGRWSLAQARSRTTASSENTSEYCSPNRRDATPLLCPLSHVEPRVPLRQQGIREWRNTYNANVESHFQALASGHKKRTIHGIGSVGELASATATRHLRPITQFVPSERDRSNMRDRALRRQTGLLKSEIVAPLIPASERLLRNNFVRK